MDKGITLYEFSKNWTLGIYVNSDFKTFLFSFYNTNMYLWCDWDDLYGSKRYGLESFKSS